MPSLTVRSIGGPTAVLDLGGLRLLTDPTFSPPGRYVSRRGVVVTKTAGPAVTPDDLGQVDAVLLSHEEHPDNLDDAGRRFLTRVPLVLTTPSGADQLGPPARALAPWSHVDLPRPGGGTLRVTGVPARHGPEGCEGLLGEVVGFVLSGVDLPTVYVSGDNASLDLVAQITARVGSVDTAVLFAGAARGGEEFLDNALLTLDSELAARAAAVLGARTVVPVHYEQWQHLGEGADPLRTAFAAAGLGDRLALLRPGDSVTC